jgi:BlaI family transcriptional regulator, penicillinase repressor
MAAIPTERELQALKVLWGLRAATVRDVWRALANSDQELAYTTVLSLMQVMEQKGLVRHRAEGKAYVYSACVEPARIYKQLAGGFLQRVFDGAVDEYLLHALASRRPSDAELDRLEQMIASARVQTQRKPRKGRRV